MPPRRPKSPAPASAAAELRELRAKHERLLKLYQMSSVIHSTLDSQEALNLLVQQALQAVGASSGSIVLINPTTGLLEILASHGLPAGAGTFRLRVGEGITGWVARTGKPARVADVTADPRYIRLREATRSELAVPLEVNGEVRGVLNVDADHANAFSAEDEALLESLAAQASQVICNTWLYEQLRLKAQFFESLASVSQAINSEVNLADALNVITAETARLMRAKMCSLLLLDSTGEWLELRACHGAGESYVRKPPVSVADSLLGTVVRRGKPYQVENVQLAGMYQNTELARREGLFGMLSVPLLYQGKSLGTLNVYMAAPHSFSNEEIRILSALAQLSAIAIEKARLYERIVDVEEQLRSNEKLSALGLLAAEVAHEIRNPLTVMKMLYHSLNLSFAEGDPRNKDARIIAEKIDHLNRIVDRMLDIARTAEPQFGPVSLGELLQELGLLVRHKLKQQQVEWVTEISPDLPAVRGDAPQLEQAFLNLVLNAAEAMPEGGRLTVSCRPLQPRRSPEATHVRVQFRDTGQGMPREQVSNAFESVLRTTKPKGTGLGLAIVRRIVDAHHGKLRIVSRPGQGTTVTLVLPVHG